VVSHLMSFTGVESGAARRRDIADFDVVIEM
jgi:hypothetical protein